ncbi:MAG: quinone-dependent dihydroorotate dehydrogenase [Verrucomicrobiota bacterium]|nr:quinone-dependent dihydroorotate dehydrogenase [Verrucomicrobiota bacterium]
MGFIYENIVRPVLFKMDPEQAHHLGRNSLMTMSALPTLCNLARSYNLIKESEPVKLFGLEFVNRVGLAAGMDKDGEFPRAIEALGFGHAEVGTVTPFGQSGNPTPRLFRYPEHNALINRMGFNNNGAGAMHNTLSKNYHKAERGMPVGVNIGKAKMTPLEDAAQDYLASFRKLADQADYFTINVSSPNTQGLRDLQGATFLRDLLQTISDENLYHAKSMGHIPHPLLLKIAPDLSFKEIDEVLEVLLDLNYDGIIATNTTVQRPEGFKSNESGGLSGGNFIRQRSNDVIKHIHKSTSGKLPIIGAGGIDSVESACEKIDAGASLVQIYTGWIYRGPFFTRKLVKGLKSQN